MVRAASTRAGERSVRRQPLSRDRVLRAAVGVADTSGVEGLTMKAVGDALGVEAMALYRHVTNKDELLSGIVRVVLEEVHGAAADLDTAVPAGGDWRDVLRTRILRARGVLHRHQWAPGLITSRGTPDGSTLPWFEDLCAVLFDAGFSDDLVHHALHVLGSRALGFTQELFSADTPPDAGAALDGVRTLATTMPNVARVAATVAHPPDGSLGGCDDEAEFAFGLDVVLDGLEARRRERPPT